MKLALVSFITLIAVAANAQQQADLVVINAKVRTMHRSQRTAEAVAVAGNKIIAVGSNAAIRRSIGPKTIMVDASGRLLLPGFNDAHVHFMAIGNKFSSIDLRRSNSGSDIVREIEHYVKFLPNGRWVLGGQWRYELWPKGETPNRKLIDAVTPDNPVLLYNSDSTTALVNRVALDLARINKQTKDPSGGEIVRDPSGEPTGLLKGKAVDLVQRLVPQDHARNWKEIAQTATNYAASLGVTSVQDVHSDDLLGVYRELEKEGKLKTRVYDCVSLSDWAKTHRAFDDGVGSMARQGCVKSFTEGDDDWTPTLKAEILTADKAGVQVAVHAIGTKPNEILADIFEEVARQNGSRDRRFRAEHAEGPSAESLRKYAALGVIASVQPSLFASGGLYREMFDANVPLALGSDAPMTDLEPMLAIDGAVRSGLSIQDAIFAHTFGSAYAEFREAEKGALAPGRLADMVIWSANVFSDGPKGIRSAKAVITIVNGKIVYESK
jgi:predicted amidohydrolase YtcJ